MLIVMKYKILENPSCEEAYDLVQEALRKRATILIFAYCKVNYEGRALSELNWGERIIMIKPDGAFLIHQEKKVEPVNWQPPKSRTRTYISDDNLFLESHRRTPKELLTVEIKISNSLIMQILKIMRNLNRQVMKRT